MLLLARTPLFLSDSGDRDALIEQQGLPILRALLKGHGLQNLYQEWWEFLRSWHHEQSHQPYVVQANCEWVHALKSLGPDFSGHEPEALPVLISGYPRLTVIGHPWGFDESLSWLFTMLMASINPNITSSGGSNLLHLLLYDCRFLLAENESSSAEQSFRIYAFLAEAIILLCIFGCDFHAQKASGSSPGHTAMSFGLHEIWHASLWGCGLTSGALREAHLKADSTSIEVPASKTPKHGTLRERRKFNVDKSGQTSGRCVAPQLQSTIASTEELLPPACRLYVHRDCPRSCQLDVEVSSFSHPRHVLWDKMIGNVEGNLIKRPRSWMGAHGGPGCRIYRMKVSRRGRQSYEWKTMNEALEATYVGDTIQE